MKISLASERFRDTKISTEISMFNETKKSRVEEEWVRDEWKPSEKLSNRGASFPF